MLDALFSVPPYLQLKALIGPHAGYSYSGPTAAHGYANIDPSQVTDILLGPSTTWAFGAVLFQGLHVRDACRGYHGDVETRKALLRLETSKR